MATEREVTLEGAQAAPRRAAPIGRAAPPVLLCVALCALYGPVVTDMVGTWWTNENASHGFLVPFVVGYFAWERRRGAAAAAQRWGWALVVIAVGLLLYPFGILSDVHFLPRVSLLVVLGGLMLYLLGPAASRLLAFAYGFLWFAIPWPDTLVEFLSFPMQLFSARFAAMITGLFGVPVMRDGVDIHLPRYTFSVGAPCSGMKSLVALLAVGALAAYILTGPIWKRGALFALTVPLALIANVVRILCILAIGSWWGRDAAQGFLHGFSGVAVVYVTAAVGLAGVARMLGLRYPSGRGPCDSGGDAPAHATAPPRPHQPSARPWPTYLPPLALLAVTALLVVGSHAATEAGEPISSDFSLLPMETEQWQGEDLGPLDRTSQEMLRPDAYVARLYVREDGYWSDIAIVVGREKETFHSPGFCLLGGGWNILEKNRRKLSVGAGAPLVANEFLLQRQDFRRVVLYWFASHEETSPSWVIFQYRLLRNRLLNRPSGGALIRVTAPVAGSTEAAVEAAEELLRELYPTLNAATGL